eukprot:jgi/Tetstr1/434761/TSEL_023812.t1
MKNVDKRMALVTLTSDFGSPGTSGVVCANHTCEDFMHFAETVAVLVLGLPYHAYVGAYFVGQCEVAWADDVVDMFEGTGPGCKTSPQAAKHIIRRH